MFTESAEPDGQVRPGISVSFACEDDAFLIPTLEELLCDKLKMTSPARGIAQPLKLTNASFPTYLIRAHTPFMVIVCTFSKRIFPDPASSPGLSCKSRSDLIISYYPEIISITCMLTNLYLIMKTGLGNMDCYQAGDPTIEMELLICLEQ